MERISTKPTILIGPGSFSPASIYHDLTSGLKANRFEVFIYDLPSASRKPSQQAATLAEDAMFFNGVLTSLCDAGKDVIILGHSYGGMVISECARGLTTKHGGRGRVVGLVYMTALVPLEGQSLGVMTAVVGLDFVKADGDFLYHDSPEKTARVVFSDIPKERGMELAKAMPFQSGPSFQNGSQYAGYCDVDTVVYIFCTQDNCLPPDFQEQMIENARAGGKLKEVYNLASGHCPNVSQPEKVVEVITEAVKTHFG